MVKRRKKTVYFISLLLLTISLSGCWDHRDVTQLNFATAVGMDKTADGKIELTVEIVKPSEIKAGQEGGGGGGEKKEKAVWIFSVTGDTVFEAVRNTLSTVDEKLFLNHTNLIVIGEKLARDGLMDGLDFWERDPESNVKAQVLVAKGTTVKKIMEGESELEKIPSMHLTHSIEINEKALGTTKVIKLLDLLKEIRSPGKDPVISTIQIVRESEKVRVKDMKIEGAAVFKKDKLVGYLNPKETRGLLFAENKAKSGIINIPNPLAENKKIAFEMTRSTGKKDAKLIDGKPVLFLEIKEVGNIGGQQGTGDITRPEIIVKLQKEIEKAIEQEVKSTVKAAQEYKADIFGFGEIIHRKYPADWKEIKDNWNELFSSAPVEIKVKAKIRRSGYIKQSTKPE